MDHLAAQSITSDQHLCYVRCNFCSTILARLVETVNVKCGHCSNLSFLTTKPPPNMQTQCYDHHHQTTTIHQGFCSDFNKVHSSSSSSCISTEPSSPEAPFVVKPPEKKHRLPSAYNRFMKKVNLCNFVNTQEEIQRIKTANPEIPHREAFSSAAKNWAMYIPHSSDRSVSSSSNNVRVKDEAK